MEDLKDTDKPNQHMCLHCLEWHLQHRAINHPHFKANQFSRHHVDQQEVKPVLRKRPEEETSTFWWTSQHCTGVMTGVNNERKAGSQCIKGQRKKSSAIAFRSHGKIFHLPKLYFSVILHWKQLGTVVTIFYILYLSYFLSKTRCFLSIL